MSTLITKNKKAYFDYEIIKTFEAGIELLGHEVKSIRQKQVNLKGSYVSTIGNALYLKQAHISAWKALPNRQSVETERERKVFLHKKDILFLQGKMKEKGFSIIPLELYFVGSLIKLKVGLCKGRKAHNKKQLLKERTLDKEAKMVMKNHI